MVAFKYNLNALLKIDQIYELNVNQILFYR